MTGCGSGVSLRIVDTGDVPALTDLCTSQAAHLQPWEPARSADFYTEAVQRRSVDQALRSYDEGSAVPFLIVSGTDEILGRMNLNGIVRGALQSCALGYWVRSDCLRRGIATQAVAQAVSFAFDDLQLHRVQAETLPENVPSQRVLRRNSFELYGAAPKYLKINGDWRDHLMFQRLSPQ